MHIALVACLGSCHCDVPVLVSLHCHAIIHTSVLCQLDWATHSITFTLPPASPTYSIADQNIRLHPYAYVLMQLAPAALQKAQDGQHSSETKETVADRQASSAPLGEAASDADTRIVTEPQGPQPLHIQPQALELSSAEAHPAITTAQSLSAVMVGGILEDKKALHDSEPKVSELPICSASLRRSASLPNNLATLPAALKGASDSTVQAAKPDPYNSSATTQGKANKLSGPECYDTKGMSGATHPNLSWGVSNDLQSVHSLPIVPAAVEVVPPCPPDASAPAPAATVFAPHSAVAASAAAAAAGNMPHNLPRNSAAGALYRSAFQPYNSKSSSLGSKATYTADNISSQFRLVCIPGSVAGKNDHTGIQTSQGSQAPTADDKENVLPAATGNESLTSNVLKGLDSMKAFGAVNTSAVSSTRQSFEGTDVRAEACGGSHSGMQEMTAGVHGMPLDLCGPDSTDLGETGASKRAKFTHGFD